MAHHAQVAAADARVAWVSGAYGYNGDLIYFRDIFAEFARRFPSGIVPVDRSFPVGRYPELPLRPILAFIRLKRSRRRVGDVEYLGVYRVPTLGAIVRLLRTGAHAHILIEFSPTSLAGFVAARIARRRTILLLESDPAFRGAPGGRLSLMVKRFVARRADAIVVSNRLGERFLRKTLGVEHDRVVVGPYLTSAPAAPTGEPAPTPGPARILFLNSVTKRKGIGLLVEALSDLPAELADAWTLDIVGSGDELEPLRERVKSLGLDARVRFHGRVAYADTGRFYTDSDLVVCPTLADYRSLNGFEAVNAGKPVLISTYDGAHEEIVAVAPAATVIDPRDHEALTAALAAALDLAALAVAQRAAAQVPPDFTVDRVGENLARAVTIALSRR
ncbi:glycosyltransferase family 4 protein [Leifsonia sp. RAF41]|uniref:glycosyltransferase family 4 protein n=1 Tax=Leifsonia sp. RAF41 TaxID=3233056 RepID=UPI003F9EA61F